MTLKKWFSFLLQPQNYQSSSTLPEDNEGGDASKDLEMALDESFRSILGGGSGSGSNKENREANSGTVFKVSVTMASTNCNRNLMIM